MVAFSAALRRLPISYRSAALLKQPIPNVVSSLTKYAAALQPLITTKDFENTQNIIKKFLQKDAEKLQIALQKRSDAEESWLAGWWQQCAYLAYRESVVINVSPGIVFPTQPPFSSIDDELSYASRFIYSLLLYKATIDTRAVPQEFMGKNPLCMDQYYNVLCCGRIPLAGADSVYNYSQDFPKHVIVFRKNHAYVMDIYDSNLMLLSPRQIQDRLKKIHSETEQLEEGHPIGLFSSAHRDDWAKNYKRLSENPANAMHLDEINRAILIVCLDKAPLDHPVGDRRTSHAHNSLHGCGSRCNSGNRWFDKSIQFLVTPDGMSGFCYEHTNAEGPPVAAMIEHALDVMHKDEIRNASGPSEGTVAPVRPLKFELDSHLLGELQHAGEKLDKRIADMDLLLYGFSDFGKNFPKSQKLSPDGFCQVAFQIAFYRQQHKFTATYESGSLRKFKLGRTDTIRGCTPEAVALCKALVDESVTNEKTLAKMIQAAIERHRVVANEAVNGEGCDRHLLGLRLIAKEIGHPMPEFFEDPSYGVFQHFRMSTSQVPMRHKSSLAFGAVVPDGYGICYNPREEEILLAVSSYHSCPETSSPKFAQEISRAFQDMQHILLAAGRSAASAKL